MWLSNHTGLNFGNCGNSRASIPTILKAELADKETGAKNMKPKDLMDMRFVAELEKKAGGK